MDEDRVAQVEKLGMVWSHYDVAWEEGLAAAVGCRTRAPRTGLHLEEGGALPTEPGDVVRQGEDQLTRVQQMCEHILGITPASEDDKPKPLRGRTWNRGGEWRGAGF
ncbi:hypothetical protein [Streptomyces africanus]|uniref:hypothetical protein n=1 Tax=Streptomyces africanus TaxID=231024 RepID=UPI003CC54258